MQREVEESAKKLEKVKKEAEQERSNDVTEIEQSLNQKLNDLELDNEELMQKVAELQVEVEQLNSDLQNADSLQEQTQQTLEKF